MKEGRSQGGAGVALVEHGGEVLDLAGSAAGDDRHLHGVADRAGEREIVAGLGAVAVPRWAQATASSSVARRPPWV